MQIWLCRIELSLLTLTVQSDRLNCMVHVHDKNKKSVGSRVFFLFVFLLLCSYPLQYFSLVLFFIFQAFPNKMSDSESIKKMLMAVLQSSKTGVSVSNLQSEYSALCGEIIPLKKLGFSKLEDYLRSIPSVVRLEHRMGEVLTRFASFISKLKPLQLAENSWPYFSVLFFYFFSQSK